MRTRPARTRCGSDSTHCRTDTSGITRSTSNAAVSTIRRVPHDDKNPRLARKRTLTLGFYYPALLAGDAQRAQLLDQARRDRELALGAPVGVRPIEDALAALHRGGQRGGRRPESNALRRAC